MSQSNLQVLLHASELKQMVDAVKDIMRTQVDFVGGCLFGLWRNSLKQPVIQFVTGPHKGFKGRSSVEDIFYNQYNNDCEKILLEQHAMLKLGYWFAGTDKAKEKGIPSELSCNLSVQRQNDHGFPAVAFDQTIEEMLNRDSKTKGGLLGSSMTRTSVHRWVLSQSERAAITQRNKVMVCRERTANHAKAIFLESSYNLLLLTTVSDNQELSVQYLLRKDVVEWGLLCREDVLSGHSSFRIYEPLTKQIKNTGAQYSTKSSEENDLNNFSKRIQQLPSRTEVRDPETKKEQWYSSEDGMRDLQKLFQYLNEASIQVDMSRDATTHNIQFNLNSGYCLDFPVDFPRQMPRLSDHHGTIIPLKYQCPQNVDICRTVVDAVYDCLLRQAGRRSQRGGKHQ